MGNLFARLFGGFLAAFFVTFGANAEERTNPTYIPVYSVNGGNGTKHLSKEAACTDHCTVAGRSGCNFIPQNTCNWRNAMGWYNSPISQSNRATCDAGWSLHLVSGWCVRPSCAPDEVRNPAGVCEKNCEVGWEKDAEGVCRKDCTNRQGRGLLDDIYDTDENGEGQYDDCKVKCEKVTEYMSVSLGGDEHEFHSAMRCKYTGASADDNDKDMGSTGRKSAAKTPNKPNDCLAEGQGYIQSSTGAITCVGAKTAPAAQKPKASKETTTHTTTKTNPDDPTQKTTQTTTVTDYMNSEGEYSGTKKTTVTTEPDGTRTTTTTTSTKNGDGTTTEKTETTTEKDADGDGQPDDTDGDGEPDRQREEEEKSGDDKTFCFENPDTLICQKISEEEKKSSFDGGCDSGFYCSGDAATCAIAKAANDLKCQGQRRDSLNDLGESVINGADGHAVENIPVTAINLANISSGGGGGGSCPALPAILGHQIDNSDLCTILSGLGNAGVALSLLMAGFIVVGGIRGL